MSPTRREALALVALAVGVSALGVTAFAHARDGQPAPRGIRSANGGIMRIVPVLPGATGVHRASLRNWASLEPGAYEVQCALEMTFTRGGVNPILDDAYRGAIWLRRFDGVVRFTIR